MERITPATPSAASAHRQTAHKAARVAEHLSEFLLHLVNENSVGQCFVQEHVRKSVGALGDAEATVRGASRDAAEGRFEANGAMEAVAGMHAHGPRMFKSMQRSLARCTELVQSLPPPLEREAGGSAGNRR
jgi:hypothetical protein